MSRRQPLSRPRFARRLVERISSWQWLRFGRPLGGDPARPVEIVDTAAPGLKPEGDVLVALPGVNFPPRGSLWFDRVADADVGAGASVDVIAFTIPATMEFVIRYLGFNAESELALSDLTWSVIENGNAVNYMHQNSGVIGGVNTPAAVQVSLFGRTEVVLRLSNNGLDTRHFIARLAGYFYRTRQERRA